jgi:aldose 1-epimerase
MVGTRGAVAFSTRLLAAGKAIWFGGSPFAALTAVWPVNEQGKYEIAAEGIRIAFTNHGAAVSNVWVKDANGEETDVVLGLDHADMYPQTESNPYLNGVIGMWSHFPLLWRGTNWLTCCLQDDMLVT